MKHNYYYLVAGLVDLLPGTAAKGFDYLTLRNEILEELSPADQQSVAWLCHYYDNKNIAAIVQGHEEFDQRGFFSLEELQSELQAPLRLPAYVSAVISSFKEQSSERPLIHLLQEAYFAELTEQNSWLAHWGHAFATLQNIVAALGARHLHLSQEESVIIAGEDPEVIQRSTLPDFGLLYKIPSLEHLLAAYHDNKKLEETIDHFTWHKADELSEGCYFSIEVVLGFLVKLHTVERWMRLDEEHGIARLEALMADLKSAPAA